MNIYRKHRNGIAAALVFALVCLLAAQADDRTMRVSVIQLQGPAGAPPAAAFIRVSAGYATNPNPSEICFYVEYSDDLTNWTALSSWDFTGTNTERSVVCTMTYDLGVAFCDLQAGRSAHRYYRAVEVPTP